MASERILNPIGRRHQRRRYSEREWRLGVVLLAILGMIIGWVWRRGDRVPSNLLPLADSLRATGVPAVEPYRRPLLSWLDEAAPTPVPSGAVVGAAAAQAVACAPFAAAVVGDGWTPTEPVAAFGPDNAYVRIDGRDEFYLGFGLRSLHCLTLAGPGGATIDLELFRLGSPADAAGALLAEVADAAAQVAVADGCLRYLAGNAGFLARGEHYLRVIGSDRGDATHARVAAILAAEQAALPAGELPWAFALFGQTLGVEPRHIGYHRQDAFGFAFARDVYTAAPPGEEGEWFVVRVDDESAARDLAARFLAGFASYGEPATPVALPSGRTAPAVRDRWLGAVSTVVAAPPHVAGVRGAGDDAAAGDLLRRLLTALGARAVFAPEAAASGAPPEADRPRAADPELGAPRGGAGGGP